MQDNDLQSNHIVPLYRGLPHDVYMVMTERDESVDRQAHSVWQAARRSDAGVRGDPHQPCQLVHTLCGYGHGSAAEPDWFTRAGSEGVMSDRRRHEGLAHENVSLQRANVW